LILGCGRSGTSIFGELFEQLPNYHYYSEPSFETVLDLDFANPVAVKVPTESHGHLATPGLSFPLPTLLSHVPASNRVYWQVRHPLDTIASLKVGISKNWGHHPRPPDWEDCLSLPLVQRCAHHWAYINTIGYQAVENLAKVCKFEDMLADPHKFSQNICVDIGLNISSCASELSSWSRRVQNTNNSKFIEAKTSRAYSTTDHNVRIGRWRENLSGDDLEQVVPIVRKAAKQFAYELP